MEYGGTFFDGKYWPRIRLSKEDFKFVLDEFNRREGMGKTFEDLSIGDKIDLIYELKYFVERLEEFVGNEQFKKLLENQGLEIVVPDLEKMVHDVLNS